MSNSPNHRRGHGRIQDHGPTWESSTPCEGCNSTHVARSRKKWKRRNNRGRRRIDKNLIEFSDIETLPGEPPKTANGYRKMS